MRQNISDFDIRSSPMIARREAIWPQKYRLSEYESPNVYIGLHMNDESTSNASLLFSVSSVHM